MHVPHYKLSFDNFYQEFKDFCINLHLDFTIGSSKAVNVINLNTETYYHSAIFCLENNIAPTIIDLVGQQRNRTWNTHLLIGPEQQTSWPDFNVYLDSVEGGNKMVAPYALLVPITGSVIINFKSYKENVINNKQYSFDPGLVGDTILSLKLDSPYLVSALHPVDIITKDFASLYLIYRFICPRHFVQEKWLGYTLYNFKKVRLLQ